MPNFKNSRRLSAGGDGQTSTSSVHDVVVNKHPKSPKRGERIRLSTETIKKPVSVSYTDTTPKQIVDEQFRQAEDHELSIAGDKDTVYKFIKFVKFLLMVAMVIGGGAFVMGWKPESGAEISDGIRIMSAIVFCVGPIIAFILDHYLEKGVFAGVSKLLAWVIITGILLEEMGALRAGRDPSFADWLMIDVGPFSLGFIVASLTVMGYLRSDLRRKRNLMQMRQRERDTIAKNATGTRMLKANNEARQVSMQRVGTWATGIFQKVLGYPVIIVASLARACVNIYYESWDSTDISLAAKGKKVSGSKSRKTTSKKQGQGRTK